MPYIITAVIVIVAIVFYGIYVRLITKRNKALEALSGIDVQLTKRRNVIDNVLKLAKKFMEHERSLLESITQLRTEVQKQLTGKEMPEDMKKRFEAENELGGKMQQLLIAVENYPNLKSDAAVVQAQQTYNEIEEHLAAARRFYNAAVNDLKNAVQIFPSSFVASVLDIKEFAFFEADEGDKKPVNVDDVL